MGGAIDGGRLRGKRIGWWLGTGVLLGLLVPLAAYAACVGTSSGRVSKAGTALVINAEGGQRWYRSVRVGRGKKAKRWVAHTDRGRCVVGHGHVVSTHRCSKKLVRKWTITDRRARSLLTADQRRAARSVNQLVTVPLTQAEFDGLVAFVFDAGVGRAPYRDKHGRMVALGLIGSGVLGALQAGDDKLAGTLMRSYIARSEGLRPGRLIAARNREADPFLNAPTCSPPPPPPPPSSCPDENAVQQAADGNGTLTLGAGCEIDFAPGVPVTVATGKSLTLAGVVTGSGVGEARPTIVGRFVVDQGANLSLTGIEITTAGASGIHGPDGVDGVPGVNGTDGANGINGVNPGDSGTDGQPGTDGTDGTDGTKAKSGTDGQGGAIFNAGTLTLRDDLFDSDNVYGGDGGNGRAGGNGGFGGSGGVGGNGVAGNNGGSGGNGGNGAAGGNGGAGGDGGDGGDGGTAQGGAVYNGPTGAVAIDSSSFTGDSARGGFGGLGGDGAYNSGGGFGGYGGIAGDGSTPNSNPAAGSNGGHGGSGGNAGDSGASGSGGAGGAGGAGYGGAIYNAGGRLTILASAFSQNGASGGPGGEGAVGGPTSFGGAPAGGNAGRGGTGGAGFCSPPPTPCTPGAGGNGGDGGRAGNGGRGSDSGDGGDAGDGGSAGGGAIYSTVPVALDAATTFIANGVSAVPGEGQCPGAITLPCPGTAYMSGPGGPAGMFAFGGGGGSGSPNGSDGAKGPTGTPGIDGAAGSDGMPGKDGTGGCLNVQVALTCKP